MNFKVIALTGALLGALVGCNQGTPGGEGVSTKPGQKPPMHGEVEGTFNLSLPRSSTTIRQGQTKDLPIVIERGKNFQGDVTLEFAKGPEGVTLASAHPVIKHGDSQTTVSVTAREDASLGDFTIKVTGHPAKGPDAINELKVSIAKK